MCVVYWNCNPVTSGFCPLYEKLDRCFNFWFFMHRMSLQKDVPSSFCLHSMTKLKLAIFLFLYSQRDTLMYTLLIIAVWSRLVTYKLACSNWVRLILLKKDCCVASLGKWKSWFYVSCALIAVSQLDYCE